MSTIPKSSFAGKRQRRLTANWAFEGTPPTVGCADKSDHRGGIVLRGMADASQRKAEVGELRSRESV